VTTYTFLKTCNSPTSECQHYLGYCPHAVCSEVLIYLEKKLSRKRNGLPNGFSA
jgi:hypothetical protein